MTTSTFILLYVVCGVAIHRFMWGRTGRGLEGLAYVIFMVAWLPVILWAAAEIARETIRKFDAKN